MNKNWSENQKAALLGELYAFKSVGHELVLIDAVENDSYISIEYIMERKGNIETVYAKVPYNCIIPSVTEIFPQGWQMEQELSRQYPIQFRTGEHDKETCYKDVSVVEWGPYHPLLPEPVIFHVMVKDEVIERISIETGFNHRGLEALCAGKKPSDVLDMLERISLVNGIPMGMAFVHAVETINNIVVPEKAQLIRMILMEMSFLSAALQSLGNIAQSLELLACSSKIFKLINLYYEATSLIAQHPNLLGLNAIGGIAADCPKSTWYAVNAILQEMDKAIKNIGDSWKNSRTIEKRLKSLGKVDKNMARMMTGRLKRAAGYIEDPRKYSGLPWSKLSYSISTGGGSNCFDRAMLVLDDALLSLRLIEQIIENLPEGRTKIGYILNGSGQALTREPEAYGAMAALVRQEEGRIKSVKLRNAATLNFPFLPGCLKGIEIIDLPLVFSTFDLDLSSMEK
jgi:ech hydrogenase subunit E